MACAEYREGSDEMKESRIGIMTDSHSGIREEEARRLGVRVLPMPFYLDDVCHYENVDLTREEFFRRVREGAKVSTSQPSPESVSRMWDEMLEEYDEILYIPISSGLSGACSTAYAMAQDKPYQGRVHVVDNGRVSTPQHRSVLDALELREEGYDASAIRKILERHRADMVIYVGVSTLEFLRRGGRITAASAALGSLLNIKPILKFDVGILDTYRKCRSFHAVKKELLEAMRHDLDTRFQKQCESGGVYLLAASSASPEETQEWVREIEEAFPGMPVLCDELSLGVSCHIGPGGLGIGCSVRPERP